MRSLSMVRVAALACLIPLPALAELAAPVAAALDICLEDGPSATDRRSALLSSGWQPVTPADQAAAAQALAPIELIRLNQLSADYTPGQRAELFLKKADDLFWFISRANDGNVWLSLPGGAGFLNIRSSRSEIVCHLSADLSPDLIAETIAGPIEVQELPPVRYTYFRAEDGWFDSPVLMIFAPDAFGALPILPILATPPVAAAD